MDEAYPEKLSIEQVHPTKSVDEQSLRHLLRHVIDAEDAALVHLTVVLADHDPVRELNRSYLDHDYNTDVLSFSLRDQSSESGPPRIEGEVYVDLDTAEERHEEFDASFEHEAFRYAVHGLLHLLGYDDKTEAGNERMREKENQYLSEGLDDVPS